MAFKRAIAAVGAAAALCLMGAGVAISQDLKGQLQTAVDARDWGSAITIVDRLIDTQGSTPELLNYRQQLLSLANPPATPRPPVEPVATLDGVPLTVISEQLNQTLPLQLDDQTELISTSVSGNRLIYQGRMIHLTAGDLDAQQLNSQFFKESFTRIICPNPQVTYVLDRGIELEYALVDRYNQPLVNVEVTQQTCQSRPLADIL